VGERRAPLGLMGPPAGPVLVVLAAGRARRYGGLKPLAPVGPAGEAVLDLLASDATKAGFASLVLVVSPSSAPALRYHVEKRWPPTLDVRFAVQGTPLGTVDAVLAAGEHLAAGSAFGVSNGDDLYGSGPLALVAEHLAGPGAGAEDALVGFHLANAVIGDAPVTRGVCAVDPSGWLQAIDERREVRPVGDGRFEARDGRQPVKLDGEVLVSMNLWSFSDGTRRLLEEAMRRATGASVDAEVLLPEVMGRLTAAHDGRPPAATCRVLPTEGRCIGVTHPEDLALVQADLARQVASGERPAELWGHLP